MRVRARWLDLVLVLGIGLIAIGVGMAYRQGEKGTEVELVKGAISEVEVSNKVMIDVEGEVFKPGVYELVGGARVNEALAAAGGLTAEADRDWVAKNINRSGMLVDGQKIYIPRLRQGFGGQAREVKDETGLININMATREELDKLPGIGPGLGGRIIEYREKNGGFKNINEIKLVSGIGDKLFEEIKEKIGL